MLTVAAPEYFGGGIEGENCIFKGAKSKNLPKMADFCYFPPSYGGGGGKWGKSLCQWGKCFLCPLPPWCRHWILKRK